MMLYSLGLLINVVLLSDFDYSGFFGALDIPVLAQVPFGFL